MSLNAEERARFLAEPHIAALSVADRAGRAPLTVPIWYDYEPGGDAWIVTDDDSRKAELIRVAGRFTLMVERTEPTVRYVSVQGPVVAEQPAGRELVHRMAARYLPEAAAAEYVEWAAESLGKQIEIRLRPERWLSADLSAV